LRNEWLSTQVQHQTFAAKKWTYRRKENQTSQSIFQMETSFEQQREHPYLFNNSAREQEKHMYSHIYDNH